MSIHTITAQANPNIAFIKYRLAQNSIELTARFVVDSFSKVGI